MADLPELTEQERWLLVECCDVEEDFPQLIYYLHFAFPGLSIWEKYRLAQEVIAGVVGKGVMEVMRIAYEEDSPGRLRIVSVTPVSLDELRRVWDHPLVWDPGRVNYAPELLGLSEASPERLAIGPTALGERVLEELFEAGTGRGSRPNQTLKLTRPANVVSFSLGGQPWHPTWISAHSNASWASGSSAPAVSCTSTTERSKCPMATSS